MTVSEAKKICRDYYRITNPTEEDDFMFTEALTFLIDETKSDEYMSELGGYYYGKQIYDLALKYYEMAAEYNNRYAIAGLGYIWYYGRTGKRDFEKAFNYYTKAADMGDIQCAYKVADMYKNGYYVEKDYDKYKAIIEDIYHKIRNSGNKGEILPEIYSRMGCIRAEEGRNREALTLFDEARDELAYRITYWPFFGNFTIMKLIIDDVYNVYKLREFDPAEMNLYDLYYVLQRPTKVNFTFEGKPHQVEAAVEEGGLVIRFDNKWYSNIDGFFMKAQLGEELLTTRYYELFDWEVL